MDASLRLLLCGASGRMGRAIRALAEEDPRVRVAGGIDRRTRPPDMRALMRDADVLVDFSSPQASLSAVAAAAQAGVRALVGTTGFSPAQRRKLESWSRRIALLVAPNMSPGMNVLARLVELAAAALPRFDAAVSETHHRLKKDAPSGSALRLAQALRAARPGSSAVPTLSVRAGDVVGDHTVLLAGPGERLELTHRAHSREVFARGALEAALWLSRRRPGLYTMQDMLNLK